MLKLWDVTLSYNNTSLNDVTHIHVPDTREYEVNSIYGIKNMNYTKNCMDSSTV